jgi:hypothetical protein
MTGYRPNPDPFFAFSRHLPIGVMISGRLTAPLAGAFVVIFAICRSRKTDYNLPAERLSMRTVEHK